MSDHDHDQTPSTPHTGAGHRPEESELDEHALLKAAIEQQEKTDPTGVAQLRDIHNTLQDMHRKVLKDLTEKLAPTSDTSSPHPTPGGVVQAMGMTGPTTAEHADSNPQPHSPTDIQQLLSPAQQWHPGQDWQRTRNTEKLIRAGLTHLQQTHQAIQGTTTPPPDRPATDEPGENPGQG